MQSPQELDHTELLENIIQWSIDHCAIIEFMPHRVKIGFKYSTTRWFFEEGPTLIEAYEVCLEVQRKQDASSSN